MGFCPLVVSTSATKTPQVFASALERGALQALEEVSLCNNDIGEDGIAMLTATLRRVTLPMLNVITINDDDDVNLRMRAAVAGARQRGRMLLFLGAENDRCDAAARRFIAVDGDRAATWRIWKFMCS